MSKNKYYIDQLKDPRWQKKRMEILTRDNWTCLICKRDSECLNIHHELYGKLPWEVDNKYLKTLCETCHKVVELCKSKGVIYRNINRFEYKNGFFVYVINTKIDTHKRPGKFAFLIHNLNEKRVLIMVQFCFPKDLVHYILETF